jgi:N-acyl-D-aspartate/D-glutamate deacylase
LPSSTGAASFTPGDQRHRAIAVLADQVGKVRPGMLADLALIDLAADRHADSPDHGRSPVRQQFTSMILSLWLWER